MSKPKDFNNWPPERQEEWLLRKRAANARWAAKNPKKVNAKWARWAAKNSDALKIKKAIYRQNNRQDLKTKSALYRAEDPERQKRIAARSRAKHSEKRKAEAKKVYLVMMEAVPVSYIAKVMKVPNCALKNLPPELIEAKRNALRTKRVLKQITQQIDERTHD